MKIEIHNEKYGQNRGRVPGSRVNFQLAIIGSRYNRENNFATVEVISQYRIL